jgi:hypothetical protein
MKSTKYVVYKKYKVSEIDFLTYNPLNPLEKPRFMDIIHRLYIYIHPIIDIINSVRLLYIYPISMGLLTKIISFNKTPIATVIKIKLYFS